MRRIYLFIGALILSASCSSEEISWFEGNTPLIQAHKHLLNDDLAAMFSSLVEVWQLKKNQSLAPHLNDLFIQSLDIDCGKGLDNRRLPEWLKSVTVRRSDIQSPGRESYRAHIEVNATKDIKEIVLSKWITKGLSNDSSMNSYKISDSVTRYVKRYNLNGRMDMGLYRIDVTAADQTSWSSWLILADPKARISVHWQSKDHWKVEKNALLNSHCPLPKLETTLYNFDDEKYNRVWGQTYESDYPTSLESDIVKPGRYVLAVSITQSRWQGPLIVEQTQIISKTYDVSLEE